MRKWVIFGAHGFIARHLSQHLLAQGDEICGVVRNAASVGGEGAPKIPFIDSNEFWTEQGAEALRKANAFVYLAHSSVPASNKQEPWRELSENVAPTLRAISRVLDCNQDVKIIYLSSGGQVYGDGHSKPIPETATLQPSTAYGLGKVLIEEALHFLTRKRSSAVAILRVANPVGRWQSGTRQGLAAAAVRASHAGETLCIYGDGRNKRDYFDADDLAGAIEAAATHASGARSHKIFNVGAGIAHTELELIKIVEEMVGRKVALKFVPRRETDFRYAVLDCRKAFVDLNWKAETSLRDTVSKMIQR